MQIAGVSAVPDDITDSPCYIYKVEGYIWYESDFAEKEGIGHLYVVTDGKIGTKWSDKNPRLLLPIGERNKHNSMSSVLLFLTPNSIFVHSQICSAILMRAVQGGDPP